MGRALTNIERAEEYGSLQTVIDALFGELDDDQAQALSELDADAARELGPSVARLEVIMAAESAGLCEDLAEIIGLLPPGSYTRRRLCDQLNSAISAHGWGLVYGTVG